MQISKCLLALSVGLSLSFTTSPLLAADSQGNKSPIILSDMGSFMFGGEVKTAANGETFHGDHGYTQYFIPEHSRNWPVIMWHGGGQSGKTWESTPDGRDGFWQIFTRAHWPVFIIDQPRRGRAGRTDTQASTSVLPTDNKESMAWNTFRLGEWVPPAKPHFFKNTAFPQGSYALDQFMRMQTPNTGPEPFPDAKERDLQGRAMSALLARTGPAVLMTHSLSGQYGWETAMQSPDKIKGIVSFEPGSFAFPDNDKPADINSRVPFVNEAAGPQIVPASRFAQLTKMPIVIFYGDNITSKESDIFGVEVWRVIHVRAQQFVDTVNRHGGHAILVDLPAKGLHGNTHFPFADKNNQAVAEMTEKYLHQLGLDADNHPFSASRLINTESLQTEK